MKYLAVIVLVVSLGFVHGAATKDKVKCFCPQFDISPVCDSAGKVYQNTCAANCAAVKTVKNCVGLSFDQAKSEVEKWVKEAYAYGQLGLKYGQLGITYGQEACKLGKKVDDKYGEYLRAVATELLGR